MKTSFQVLCSVILLMLVMGLVTSSHAQTSSRPVMRGGAGNGSPPQEPRYSVIDELRKTGDLGALLVQIENLLSTDGYVQDGAAVEVVEPGISHLQLFEVTVVYTKNMGGDYRLERRVVVKARRAHSPNGNSWMMIDSVTVK